MTARPRSEPRPDPWTVECKVHFRAGRRGRKRLRRGDAPVPERLVPGRVPRVARLLALAHRFRDLVKSQAIRDYADVARLAAVSRPRVTQIMNLLHLAPDIQEEVLFLPRTLRGRDPIGERDLRPIAGIPEWKKQRAMWRELTKTRLEDHHAPRTR